VSVHDRALDEEGIKSQEAYFSYFKATEIGLFFACFCLAKKKVFRLGGAVAVVNKNTIQHLSCMILSLSPYTFEALGTFLLLKSTYRVFIYNLLFAKIPGSINNIQEGVCEL
jgi:hypothetical protein